MRALFSPFFISPNFLYLMKRQRCGRKSNSSLIKNKDYAELRKNKTRKTFVYVSEYPAWFMNPNFNKYDFSLQEEDWHERDRGKRPWSFLYIFIALEAIIIMITLQL